jgi:divinyl protochlorophyllide a 8-vinyl-reductase
MMGTVVPALAAHGAAGRIGPNAITRVAEALRRTGGENLERRVFHAARLGGYLGRHPEKMVDEAEVTRLHRALRATLGADRAREVSRDAGYATGDYLLAHRIPRLVQAMLKLAPAPLAAHVLMGAIGRHAWTFAGSGAFAWTPGRPVRFEICGNPICRGAVSDEPVCDYYAATFERLFRTLVHPCAEVVETECEALGADACRFEIRW